MRTAFVPGKGGRVVFADKIEAQAHLAYRQWKFRFPGENAGRVEPRWRLEITVEPERAPLQDRHWLIVAQEPFESSWVQRARFKKRSNKKMNDAPCLPKQFTPEADPIEWLEQNLEYDPWEEGARFVAGISLAKQDFNSKAANLANGLLLGTCLDLNRITEALMENDTVIQEMLGMTEKNTILFSNPASPRGPLRLGDEVIRNRYSLMFLSIQQALAGPPAFEGWIKRPVADRVSMIYGSHLDHCNRKGMLHFMQEKARIHH
jgi:hypothetical protein